MMTNSDRSPTPATTPWLACWKPRPEASLRLFCFPYAGGGATMFCAWSDSLPSTVEVCPVQLPGRGYRLREPPFTRLRPLVQVLGRALVPHLDRPFAFFGHSMGAIISFELARHLRQAYGLEPVHVFVSGRRAPQIPDRDPPTYDLPHREFVQELRRLNGTPQEVLAHPELMGLVVPILRADFELLQTYQYRAGPPLGCSITAFGGLQDEEVPRENLQGWREQTIASFLVRMLPGDHFFVHTAQSRLLGMLSQELRRLVRLIPGGEPPQTGRGQSPSHEIQP